MTIQNAAPSPQSPPAAGLADFRRQHPEYNDMSDTDLANALYRKFYSDMPLDQFNAKLGIGPKPTSQTLGAYEGATHVMDNVASGAHYLADKVGLAAPIDALGNAVGLPSLQDANAGHKKFVSDSGYTPGTAGKIAGEVAATLPLAPLGPIAGGAAAGAATTDASTPLGVAGDAALGAGFGKTLQLGGRAVAAAVAPVVRPAVAMLRYAGVTMTPGQILGGVTKGIEDQLAGFPVIGNFITDAQNNSLKGFGRAAINTSLAPVGASLPRGLTGQGAIAHAGDTLSNAYDALLPQLSVKLDAPFAQTVADTGAKVGARLPSEMGNQFQSTLAEVFKKLSSASPQAANVFGGNAIKDATTDLGGLARAYRGDPSANNRALGTAFGEVNSALNAAVRRSNPAQGEALDAINSGYANLVPVERAAASATGNAAGREAGVFTPQQLRAAVRQGDTTVRHRAMARGEANLQPLAEAGINVLPQSVGDSGAAGRYALLGALGFLPAHPYAAIGAATIPALYSRLGLELANTVLARQSGPTATSLAEMLRNLSATAAPAVGGQSTGLIKSKLAAYQNQP